MRQHLQITVPKVLTYNIEKVNSAVGAEYIIMEKCPGIELGHIWDSLPTRRRVEVVEQIAAITAKLSKTRFSHYGSIYYSEDVPDMRKAEIDETFCIGRTTGRSWFDDNRESAIVDRGP